MDGSSEHADSARTQEPSFLHKLAPVVLSSLLVTATLFLFTPTLIYRGNVGEFDVTLSAILRLCVIPASILFCTLVVPGILWSRRSVSRYVSVICVFGILLWIQANLLVWKYGLLDGQSFDWTQGNWRGYVDAAIWLMALVLSAVFHRQVHRYATVATTSVLAIQLAFLLAAGSGGSPAPPNKFGAPPPQLSEFSSTANVIHIVFDALHAGVFQRVLDDETDGVRQALDGFTFFRENTGSFPTTYMSIPAALSGKVYGNDVPMRTFVTQTMQGQTIPNALYKKGYEVDLIHSLSMYVGGNYTNAYFIPRPYTRDPRDYEKAKAAFMMDLVLFREAPHFIKRYIYNDQKWFLQTWYVNAFPAVGQMQFFKQLVEKTDARRAKPVYKFIHLLTTHAPVVFDESGQYLGRPLPWNEVNQANQAKVALKQLVELLTKLKSLGIYDSSLIILHADTGTGHPVQLRNEDNQRVDMQLSHMVGGAMPFLAIKPPRSKGAMKTSNAQVSLTDIPATVNALLRLGAEFPGRSVFDVRPDETRTRFYYNYHWSDNHWQQDFLPPMEGFEIRGSVFDRRSWVSTSLIGSSADEPPTAEVEFGTEDARENYLLSGWGANEYSQAEKTGFNWALGPTARMVVRLDRSLATKLAVRVHPLPFPEPQNVEVRVDGHAVDIWQMRDTGYWQTYVAEIPPSPQSRNLASLEFCFSQYSTNQKGDSRPLAARFKTLSLTPVRLAGSGKDSARLRKIQFGTAETFSEHLLSGWGGNEATSDKQHTFNWALGSSSAVQVALPSGATDVSATLLPFTFQEPQVITVKVDNVEIAKWKTRNVWEFQTFTLSVPPDSKRRDISRIEFLFSQYRKPGKKESDPRPLAAMFDSIVITRR